MKQTTPKTTTSTPDHEKVTEHPTTTPPRPKETGGPKGLEPTRYGDWESKGRCIDF